MKKRVKLLLGTILTALLVFVFVGGVLLAQTSPAPATPPPAPGTPTGTAPAASWGWHWSGVPDAPIIEQALVATIAEQTGLDRAAVVAQWQGGQTPAQIARAHAGTVKMVTDAFNAQLIAELERHVRAGTITRDQVYNLLYETSSAAFHMMYQPWAERQAKPGCGVWTGRWGDPMVARSLLAIVEAQTGLDRAEVIRQWQGGQTLAQIAAAHNLTVDSATSALVAALTPQLDQQVRAGELTESQAYVILFDARTHTYRIMNQAWADRNQRGCAQDPLTPPPDPAPGS